MHFHAFNQLMMTTKNFLIIPSRIQWVQHSNKEEERTPHLYIYIHMMITMAMMLMVFPKNYNQ